MRNLGTHWSAFSRASARTFLLGAVVVAALLATGAVSGCKKDGDKKGTSDPGAMSAGAMDAMGAMTPEARRPPARRAAPAMDPALKKQLAERFGRSHHQAFEGLIAKVKGFEKLITGLGDKGKQTYPLLLASAEALLQVPKKLEEGKVQEVPPLVVNGYVMGLVTVKLLAAEIAATAKQVAKAAQALQVGKAQKLGLHAKRLAAPAKVAGELLKIYTQALEHLMTSKSEAVRLGTFLAAVDAAGKADALAKVVLLETLKRFLAAEASAAAKDRMTAALKGLK